MGQAPVLNREPSQSEDDLNNNTETVYENNEEGNLGEEGQNEGDEELMEDDEGESVYMLEGVALKVIQIEGEKNKYLMDPNGRIYDFQSNFIGTANPQGLYEMQDQQEEEQESYEVA